MKMTILLAAAVLFATGCNRGRATVALRRDQSKPDGPVVSAEAKQKNDPGHQTGDAAAGKMVFRFETFGNEGFWSDAMRLPKGMKDAKFTPVQAWRAGLHVDVEALDPVIRETLAESSPQTFHPRARPC